MTTAITPTLQLTTATYRKLYINQVPILYYTNHIFYELWYTKQIEMTIKAHLSALMVLRVTGLFYQTRCADVDSAVSRELTIEVPPTTSKKVAGTGVYYAFTASQKR